MALPHKARITLAVTVVGLTEWEHPDGSPPSGCSHSSQDHPGTIQVVVTDGTGYEVTCFYFGSAVKQSDPCVVSKTPGETSSPGSSSSPSSPRPSSSTSSTASPSPSQSSSPSASGSPSASSSSSPSPFPTQSGPSCERRGAEGYDFLKGGAGNDRLNGGPGRDVCKRGPGRNSITNCES